MVARLTPTIAQTSGSLIARQDVGLWLFDMSFIAVSSESREHPSCRVKRRSRYQLKSRKKAYKSILILILRKICAPQQTNNHEVFV